MTRHQWMLIVAISAGLVGMHHLVHAHPAHTIPMATATATHIGYAGSHLGRIDPVETGVRSTSVVASPSNCCDPMDMVGHFCLAVLTAVWALGIALMFVADSRRPIEPGHLLAALSSVAARGPPIGCARLTELCVLRR